MVPDVVVQMKLGRSEKMTLKRPGQVTLRWKQAIGLPWNDSVTTHSMTVPFEGVVPPDFAKGTIYVVIRDHDVVEVRPIRWTDDKASISLVREK